MNQSELDLLKQIAADVAEIKATLKRLEGPTPRQLQTASAQEAIRSVREKQRPPKT